MNFGWLILSYFLVFLQSIYQIVVAVYAQNKLGEMRWMYQTYVFSGIVIVGFIVLVIVQLLPVLSAILIQLFQSDSTILVINELLAVFLSIPIEVWAFDPAVGTPD